MLSDSPQRRLTLACLVAAFLVLGCFLAWVVLDHDYEAMYLGLGNLVVRGDVSLYEDGMTGHWVPLPFYVYGVSQALFGPSLWLGRLLSVAVSTGVLVLTFVVAGRWGGPVAGAVAGALFCTHGLVMGYFVTAHFAPLVAVLHLLAIYVLFCREWAERDLIAMAIVSILFLVKPHYWPTIPFVLLFLLWRARSARRRLALVAVAGAIPLLFFVWDARHLKILAYVPVVRAWVEPLGYHAWHALVEDPAAVWVSDYAGIHWETTGFGRILEMGKAFAFFLKRYAVWMLALGVFGALGLVQAARRRVSAQTWAPAGLRFTFALFWYLVAWQFVIVGPYIKQSFAYVGAIAPLIAIVIGCTFAAAWSRLGLPEWCRLSLLAGLILALVVSPWVHRSHSLPRTFTPTAAHIPVLRSVAHCLQAIIPADGRPVFLLGDPMPLYLAGRRGYLPQLHDHLMTFTSARDAAYYARDGLWGRSEVEQWLGADARYAVIEPGAAEFYGNRKPYAEPMARIRSLLADRFTLVETVRGGPQLVFQVYRRNDDAQAPAPAGDGASRGMEGRRCPNTSS
jgi:hypothetical protein